MTEILFIDEISMLSKRTFETINYIAQNIRNSNYMFGGLQVVAFGDFLQLPPVPSAIDEGKYAFQSELWQFVFPHQVILEDSFRAKDDNELVNLLKDISVGRCSDQSLNLIKTLSRPLDPAELQLDFIPKVFPLNEDVDYSNMCTLDSLPGQEVVFQAYDIGEKKLLDRELVANEKLILKVGAKVMFVYNINDRIKNGVQGTVASFLNGLPVVTTSDGTESVVVERVTWSVYDRIETHKLVGTRTQIPLKLAWAMTVHKAQGQTLEAVEVHCGREFAPGHLYVAISRVKSKDHLRVIGFNKNRLIPAAPEVLNFLDNVTNATTQPGKKCCQLTSLSSSTEEEFDFDDEPLCEENFDEIDAFVQTFLDSNVAQAEEDVIDLDSLLSQMSESEEFHKIPVDFDYGTFLRTLSIKEEELHAQELVANVNAIFTSLCEPELLQSTKVFVSVQWNRIFSLIRQQVSENPTRKVKRKDFTCHFSDLHSLLVSDALEKEFGMLINIPVSMFSECHYHALTELIYNLNSIVLKSVVGQQFPTLSNEACNIDVQNMSAEGKGKVRYCGAWAIAKERHRCKEYFKSNIRSSDPGVRKKAKEAYAKKELLEQLIWSSGMAKEESKYQDTLNVTFSWTYEKGRLVHITDQMFEWSLELEQGRVNLLNNQSLATNKEDLVSITLARMLDNQQLKHKWKALFSQRENENCDESLCDADLIAQLYDDVITRYVKMGVGEFLRDFRRDYKLQKTEAHRKKVVEKKKKKDLISSKVTMTSIRSDSSTNLKESHIRLQAMITEQPLIFQSTVYSKDELQLLCKGYGLAFKRSESKARLSEKLTTKIQASGDVPNPAALRDATQPGSSGKTSIQFRNKLLNDHFSRMGSELLRYKIMETVFA